MDNNFISFYHLLKKDILLVIFVVSYIISSGLSWFIPTPTSPILGFPFYISIYIIYISICKILNINYWIPEITKKIKINKRILDKYYIKKKTSYIFYIYVIILVSCVLIPIMDFIPALLLFLLILFYYQNKKILMTCVLIISTIFIIFFYYILFNIKFIANKLLYLFKDYKFYFILFILLWIFGNIYYIKKNSRRYKKYIKIENNS